MSTKDIITEILNARTLGALKGLREDQWFDAKRAGYDLATGAGRFELAKAVSSLANEGGYILVGSLGGRGPATIPRVLTFGMPNVFVDPRRAMVGVRIDLGRP